MKQSRYRRPEPARIEMRHVSQHQVEICRAKVARKKRVPILARLSDISAFGCCLTVDAVLPVDEIISIAFGDQDTVEASVVWQKADQIGCRFADKISPALFRAMTLQT